MDSPCSAYSGNTTRSMLGMFRRALATMSQILRVCAARSAGVLVTGSCSCTRPITTPFGDLFSPPNPLMANLQNYLVTLSSPGAPARLRRGEQVAIMIASVNT